MLIITFDRKIDWYFYYKFNIWVILIIKLIINFITKEIIFYSPYGKVLKFEIINFGIINFFIKLFNFKY
jgi:hypothetical protein